MSKVLQSMRIAFRALRVNKMRSMLTALGIIVGVAAVVCHCSQSSAAYQFNVTDSFTRSWFDSRCASRPARSNPH